MKAAIYIRISTEHQSLDQQRSVCLSYCERRNIEVYKIYEDVYTGTKDKRPGFNQLIEDMRSFRFDCVIVTKLDRMGRSLQHLLGLMDEFNKKNVKFIATSQNIDTSSSMGMLQMQMLGAFAEFERNLISERTKEALKHKKNVGKRGKDKRPRKQRSDYGKKRPHTRKNYRGGN